MTDKLLPCPFCGHEDIKIVADDELIYWEVICEGCHLIARLGRGKKDLIIDRWNRRTLPKGVDGYLRISPECKEWLETPIDE